MYNLAFKNICEIRMGSPFNVAEVVLSGEYVPDLSSFTFQDIGLVDSKEGVVYLVQWEIEHNVPGFRIWRISSVEQKVYKTDKLNGCCKKMTLVDNKLDLEILKNGQTVTVTVCPSEFKISNRA